MSHHQKAVREQWNIVKHSETQWNHVKPWNFFFATALQLPSPPSPSSPTWDCTVIVLLVHGFWVQDGRLGATDPGGSCGLLFPLVGLNNANEQNKHKMVHSCGFHPNYNCLISRTFNRPMSISGCNAKQHWGSCWCPASHTTSVCRFAWIWCCLDWFLSVYPATCI